MFSKEITASDAFLDMPASTQALYFHLGMEADDDGFIGNPKKVMRVMGVSDDDLKILISKRFVLIFSSGVLVMKHHRINNNWDRYNCKRTVYLEEFSQLYIKENKAYTLDKMKGVHVQSENSLKTVFRIEENRINNTAAIAAPILEVRESEEGAEVKKTGYTKAALEAYKKMVAWAEAERGFPFLKGDILKQYKAFKIAKDNGLKSGQLQERWLEMAEDKFWGEKGFDWMNVVASFNKKRS